MKKEFKNIIKKVSKLMFAMTLFLSFINGISAKDYSVEESSSKIDCDPSNGCFIICEYSGMVPSYIQFERDENNTWNKWKIVAQESNKAYVFSSSVEVPSSGIYWGKSESNWKKGKTEYDMLLHDYLCPKALYVDTDGYTELCFDDNDGKCAEGLTFGESNKRTLKYSYAEELSEALKNIKTNYKQYENVESIISDSNKDYIIQKDNGEVDKEKTEERLFEKNQYFLHLSDENFYYDNTKSHDENIKSNCAYIKQLSESLKEQGGIEKYADEMTKNKNLKKYLENIIAAENMKKPRPDVLNKYSFDMLYYYSNGQLNDRKFKDKEDKLHSIYYDLKNLYHDNLKTSLNYTINKCNSINTDEKIEIDVDKVVEATEKKFDVNVPIKAGISIDLDSEIKCNDIFTPEIIELITKAYFAIEILSIIILITLSSIDYAKIIMSGEQEEMKKNNQRLIKRLIVVVVIFLLPALINLTLRIIHIEGFDSDNPLCVEIKNR